MKNFEVVAEALYAGDVDTIFTYQSSGIMHLLNHVRETWSDEVRVVHARHEQAAMAMADGFSRSRDDVGVCIVGRGPAIAQTGAALVTARKANSKLLVIAASSATNSTYDLKRFDQDGYLRSTVENGVAILSSEVLLPTLRRAFSELRSGGGPICLQIPTDVLNGVDSDLAGAPIDIPEKESPGEGRLTADARSIERAIDEYLDSDATKPPVVLCGRGVIRAGAEEEVLQLAEHVGGVLTSTLKARGLFGRHPFYLGFAGEWGSTLANDFLTDAGCIFAVGCSLNPRTTDFGRLVPDDARVIQIDVDPGQFERHTDVSVGVLGDAKSTVGSMNEKLDEMDIERAGEFWTEKLRNRIEGYSILEEGDYSGLDRLDPRELIVELDGILPVERKVVSDGGHFARWVLDGIRTPEPADFIWPYDFVAIGQGLPAGIGVAIEEEEKPCFVFCGDAAFMMTIQELDTAVRNDVPVTVFIGNDDALGSEYHSLDASGKPSEYSVIETPDIRGVVRAMGAQSIELRTMDDLGENRETLRRAPDGPLVVDCHIDRRVVHRSRM